MRSYTVAIIIMALTRPTHATEWERFHVFERFLADDHGHYFEVETVVRPPKTFVKYDFTKEKLYTEYFNAPKGRCIKCDGYKTGPKYPWSYVRLEVGRIYTGRRAGAQKTCARCNGAGTEEGFKFSCGRCNKKGTTLQNNIGEQQIGLWIQLVNSKNTYDQMENDKEYGYCKDCEKYTDDTRKSKIPNCQSKKRNGTIRVSGQSKQCKIITHLSCRVDSGPDGPHTISLRFGGDRRRLSTSDTDRLHESARIIEHHYAQ